VRGLGIKTKEEMGRIRAAIAEGDGSTRGRALPARRDLVGDDGSLLIDWDDVDQRNDFIHFVVSELHTLQSTVRFLASAVDRLGDDSTT
jgi:hypothetical protein